MAAPDYFLDQLDKLRDLARNNKDLGLSKTFRMIEIVPDRGGFHIPNWDKGMPAFLIVPNREIWRPHTTTYRELVAVCWVQVWGLIGTRSAVKDTEDFLKLTARVARFLWTNKTVASYWYNMNQNQDPWFEWSYEALENGGVKAMRAEAQIRLVKSNVDLST